MILLPCRSTLSHISVEIFYCTMRSSHLGGGGCHPCNTFPSQTAIRTQLLEYVHSNKCKWRNSKFNNNPYKNQMPTVPIGPTMNH